MRRALGLLSIGLLLGCQAQVDLTQTIPALQVSPTLAVIARPNGDVVGINPASGAVRWTYVAPRRAEAERDPPPFDPEPSYRLLCPIQATPDLHTILRYQHEVVSLHQDGTLWWERGVPTGWSRGSEHCPAVAPDSGVAFFIDHGRALQKLTQEGEDGFIFPLGDVGRPVTSPHALFTSGDILVRTDHFLFSVSPAAHLNWQVPLSALAGEESQPIE